MEKRRFPRLDVNLPVSYHVQFQGPPDKSVCGKGFLANISLGGMFFKMPPPLSFTHGSIGDFTIEMGYTARLIGSRLKASARVVRIEPPKQNQPEYGVAVQFLSRFTIQLA